MLRIAHRVITAAAETDLRAGITHRVYQPHRSRRSAILLVERNQGSRHKIGVLPAKSNGGGTLGVATSPRGIKLTVRPVGRSGALEGDGAESAIALMKSQDGQSRACAAQNHAVV